MRPEMAELERLVSTDSPKAILVERVILEKVSPRNNDFYYDEHGFTRPTVRFRAVLIEAADGARYAALQNKMLSLTSRESISTMCIIEQVGDSILTMMDLERWVRALAVAKPYLQEDLLRCGFIAPKKKPHQKLNGED